MGYVVGVGTSGTKPQPGELATISMKTTTTFSIIYKSDNDLSSGKLLKTSTSMSSEDESTSTTDSSKEKITNLFPNIQVVYTCPVEIPFGIQTSSLDGVEVKVSAKNSLNRLAKSVVLDYEGNQVVQVCHILHLQSDFTLFQYSIHLVAFHFFHFNPFLVLGKSQKLELF